MIGTEAQRQRALELAVGPATAAANAADVLRIAASYLDFLTGADKQPGDNASTQVDVNNPTAAAAAAYVGKPKRAAAAKAITAESVAPIAQASAASTASAALAQNAQAPAATASASPQVIPQPTTAQAAAESLKKLVQDDSRGGREAAVTILGKFGVTQMAQIPAAKLAEFKAALDACTSLASVKPPVAAAPGSDLL